MKALIDLTHKTSLCWSFLPVWLDLEGGVVNCIMEVQGLHAMYC